MARRKREREGEFDRKNVLPSPALESLTERQKYNHKASQPLLKFVPIAALIVSPIPQTPDRVEGLSFQEMLRGAGTARPGRGSGG